MTTINAKSILASRHAETGARVDTLLLTYPRCIHAELMTHRVFSRNAASSRAIPVERMVKSVLDDPFVPLHWGRNQKGMQADEELSAEAKQEAEAVWLRSRDLAVEQVARMVDLGLHKQVANRLLEPFMHITVVVTTSDWSNFLALRDHPDAEPHIQILARCIRGVLDRCPVQELQPGQWHLPFTDHSPTLELSRTTLADHRKLSVARCASASYNTVEGYEMTLDRAAALHDKLADARPLHASPFEHQCYADHLHYGSGITNGETTHWFYEHSHLHGNLKGFVQYRKLLPGECV